MHVVGREVRSIVTDADEQLAISSSYQLPEKMEHRDTTYRMMLYYNKEGNKPIELKSLRRAHIVKPSDKQSSLTIHDDPVKLISVWKAQNSSYINMSLGLMVGNAENEDAFHKVGLVVKIEGNITRDPKDRLRMTVAAPDSGIGKPAVTHWKVIEKFGYVTLIECILETGRTHQIRAHMKHIGHPLFCDERYGGSEILRGTRSSTYKAFIQNCFKLCPRQALHAKTLGFVHPVTGEQMDFTSEWPEDFSALIEKWRNYVNGANAFLNEK